MLTTFSGQPSVMNKSNIPNADQKTNVNEYQAQVRNADQKTNVNGCQTQVRNADQKTNVY